MKPKVGLLVLMLFYTLAVLAAPPAEEGKSIFSTRCASCHSISKVLTGPALAGLHERRSMDWIVKFVQSSQSLVKSGDKDAVALFEKFNKIPMPDHPDLTEGNIKNIVEYIKSESAVASAEKAPFTKPTKIRPAYLPLSTDNYGLLLTYLALVGLLVASLLMLVQVRSLRRRMAKEQV